jgi:hypothetical protein
MQQNRLKQQTPSSANTPNYSSGCDSFQRSELSSIFDNEILKTMTIEPIQIGINSQSSASQKYTNQAEESSNFYSNNNSSKLRLYYPTTDINSQKQRKDTASSEALKYEKYEKNTENFNGSSINSKIHSNYNKYLDESIKECSNVNKDVVFKKPPKTT